MPSTVVSDRRGRPTYTVDLARATWELATAGFSGVVHAANGGIASWYDVARRIYAAADAEDLLQACSAAEYSAAARRPVWSVLETSKLGRLLGRSLPSWGEAMDKFLTQMVELPQPPGISSQRGL